MLFSAPLSLEFSRLMGSVIPYLNTSWTAVTGMSLFVSQMYCCPLFSISENKWKSWQTQTRSWQAVLCWCTWGYISPITLVGVPGGSAVLYLFQLSFLWHDLSSAGPDSSLHVAGGTNLSLCPSPLAAGGAMPAAMLVWEQVGHESTWVRRWATGKGSTGSRERNALASHLLEKNASWVSINSAQLKYQKFYVKNLLFGCTAI